MPTCMQTQVTHLIKKIWMMLLMVSNAVTGGIAEHAAGEAFHQIFTSSTTSIYE